MTGVLVAGAPGAWTAMSRSTPVLDPRERVAAFSGRHLR
jgi:hypothetical protein